MPRSTRRARCRMPAMTADHDAEIPGLRVEPLLSYADARGVLWKVHPDAVGGEVYAISIAPGTSRGHHRHQRCGEWFVGVAGGALLVVELNDRRVEVELEGVRAYVPAGVSHALFGVGDEIALVIAMADRGDSNEDVERTPVRPPDGFGA